ncbi:MAG: universal stress protein [Chloroflexota bacterium]
MYRKMLVPLDGSELAEIVFTYAKELAGRLDIEVIVLHIVTPERALFAHAQQAYLKQSVETIRRQAREVQKKTGISEGGKLVEVRGELAVGSPPEEILRYSEKENADLILMATHGRSGVRHWALGNVADKILRVSKVPVFLVRAGISDETPYDKWPQKIILVPLDGSELAESVLPHVEILAKQRSTEPVNVVLLRVCEPPLTTSYYATELSTVPLNWGDYIQQETARNKQMAGNYLAGIEKRFRDSNINVQSEVLFGKAAEEIINYANRNPFSLIVMATHGRSGLKRWVYGSVAENTLLGVSNPILLVSPQ